MKNRREVIKWLTIAGFSAFIPSCKTEVLENANIEEEGRLEIPDQDPLVIDFNNVTFYKKDNPEFANLNVGFNLNKQSIPAIIALCLNTKGVADAVKYALRNQLKIAVKSGGHSFERFSSNNDGMVIDVSLMKAMKLNEENELLAGPGVLLKELYDFLLPKSRLLPAGSCGTVGLSGLALGGGYGFFARKHGLTCDLLQEATMVDGSGNVHKAKEGDELLWALKGGNNGNFGIVTEMKFRTIEAPKHFTRHRFKAYKLDAVRAKEILQIWFQYTADLAPSCFSAFVLNGKTLTILNTNYEDSNPSIVALNTALEAVCDNASYGEPKDLATSLTNYYGIQHPLLFQNSSAGYYKSDLDLSTCIDEILSTVVQTPGLIYQINTLGGNINSSEFNANSAYCYRDYPYLSELQSYWEENQDPSNLLTAFKKIHEILHEHGINKHYRNYPFMGIADYENSYYGPNLARLKKVKAKYDKGNQIQHKQSITA